MDKACIFLLPFAMAFMAWFTARMLLYLVLYPLVPKRILGFTFHGFLLKNQSSIAEKIGQCIVKELAAQDIGGIVADEKTLESLNPLIEAHLDSYLRVRLKEKMPVIAAFIGDKTILKLKNGMMEEITVLLPEVISKYAASIASNPTLQVKITKAIATYPVEKIEAHVAPVLKKAMAKLPMAFGFIGLFVGAIMSAIIYLLA